MRGLDKSRQHRDSEQTGLCAEYFKMYTLPSSIYALSSGINLITSIRPTSGFHMPHGDTHIPTRSDFSNAFQTLLLSANHFRAFT